MKNIFQLNIIILLLLISCKKESDPITMLTNISLSADSILYSNLNYSISHSTVRAYDVPNSPTCSSIIPPIPRDSSTTMSIDVDNDSINDFQIGLSHYSQQCSHCTRYVYSIFIKGIDSLDYVTDYFGNSDTISYTNSWTNYKTLKLEGGCIGLQFNIENEYIGIKHENLIGWVKINSEPNNGFRIENYAINLIARNPILAGQVK